MAKKKTVKRNSPRPRKASSSQTTRYILIGITVVVLLLLLLKLTSTVHVLGAKTGPVLLARGGDDSGSSGSGGEDEDSHSGGESNSGGSGSSGGNTGKSENSQSASVGNSNSGGENNNSGSSHNSGSGSTSKDAKVDCVGPDGKHFTSSYKGCAELNNKWHISNFTFTPLNTQTKSNRSEKESKKTEVQEETHQEDDGRVESELQIESASGSVKIKTKTAAGHETEVESELEEANDALKNTDIELRKSGDNEVALIRNKVKTNTSLPIKINPATHQLIVSLPSGDKEIAILPDEAINRLLLKGVFTSVESEATSSATEDAASLQTARLTELNNEAVFEVRGISQKKVLGIIPVGFAKTAFISASTGEVVKTDQSFINSLLERISL